MAITVSEARDAVLSGVECQQPSERCSLTCALGRTLAADVVATCNVPSADNSAMDGFALAVADICGDTRLRISQRIAAGQRPESLQPGTAARIFTGGEMPPGADAVVIQEHCNWDDKSVSTVHSVKRGDNVRPIGQDIRNGDVIAKTGELLGPVELGLIASVGVAEVSVFKSLKVALFSTGDELQEPGQPLQRGQIYNSNRVMLAALCQRLGFEIIDHGGVKDSLDATLQALQQCADQADVIITSGGVSVGDEDHIRPAVQQLGDLEFWKVQMKPGKPVVVGRVGETPFVGLPGNPVSAFVVFQLLAIPLLCALQGRRVPPLFAQAVVAGFSKARVSREEFLRVKLNREHTETQAELFENQSSGVLRSLSWADGLVRQRIGQAIEQGDRVEFLPLYQGVLCPV